MGFDPAYLGRSLDGRLHDVQESMVRQVKALQNTHAAAGRLQSGATLIAFERIAVDCLKSSIGEASKFAFELTSGDEPAVGYLRSFAERVQQIVLDEITEKASRLGLGQVTTNHLEAVKTKLDRIKDGLLDDFANGMHGSERLKKDPVVNAVINQTNSPGAVAQVGAGSFSQTAFTQHHNQLIETIDQVMRSPEFTTLTVDQQQGFRDIADVVKTEARASQPDTGKLQRWGRALVSFATDVGMHAASAAIAEVLMKIFC
jgi:hypothetical protein